MAGQYSGKHLNFMLLCAGKCVVAFDHYCMLINTTVGDSNHALFLAYCTLQLFLILWGWSLAWHAVGPCYSLFNITRAVSRKTCFAHKLYQLQGRCLSHLHVLHYAAQRLPCNMSTWSAHALLSWAHLCCMHAYGADCRAICPSSRSQIVNIRSDIRCIHAAGTVLALLCFESHCPAVGRPVLDHSSYCLHNSCGVSHLLGCHQSNNLRNDET